MSEPDLGGTVVEQPPVHDAAPPLQDTAQPPAEDAADDVIEIPTGEKLVPLSALTKARDAIKDTKAERDALKAKAEEAEALRAERERIAAELEALRPRAAAYDAAIQAQAREPERPAEPTAEETAELREVAKLLDLYTPDGSPDLERAAKVQQLTQRTAERVAGAKVAPLEQRSVQAQAAAMFQKALLTAGADGVKPHPDDLTDVWRDLEPAITATTAGAVHAWSVALGRSAAKGRLQKTAPAAPKGADLPPPLTTERAGGRDSEATTLRASDIRAARSLGISDKEYAAMLADMPEGWGKHR